MINHNKEVANLLKDALTDWEDEDIDAEIFRIPHQQSDIIKNIIKELENSSPSYDENFGDDKICKCGHSYYRHFDSWDNMYPVGCKYCGCNDFQENV